MPSILSDNQPSQNNNPIGAVRNLVNQIMSSANPQQTFNMILSQSKDAQNAMNLVNQYGNGDPKQAFLNYASQTGKQSLGQKIMEKLGLM